jgi:3-hydroxyisobutyrate dehydrogenase
MVKDIRIALELAARQGTPVPLWELGQTIWKAADETAGSGASVSELVRYIEREAGVEIS